MIISASIASRSLRCLRISKRSVSARFRLKGCGRPLAKLGELLSYPLHLGMFAVVKPRRNFDGALKRCIRLIPPPPSFIKASDSRAVITATCTNKPYHQLRPCLCGFELGDMVFPVPLGAVEVSTSIIGVRQHVVNV